MVKDKMSIKRMVTDLLFELGASRTYVGFDYICYGIQVLLDDQNLLVFISKGLYLEISIKFNVPVASVERDIRTIKNKIWKNHKDSRLFKGFKKAPTNGAFIDILLYEVEKRMRGESMLEA